MRSRIEITYRFVLAILIAMAFFNGSQAQEVEVVTLEGKISYKTSQRVYVKFGSTENIQEGDTLFIQKDGILEAAAIVVTKSSISVVCRTLHKDLNVDDPLIYRFITKKVFPIKEIPSVDVVEEPQVSVEEPIDIEPESAVPKRKRKSTRGRIGVSAHSNFRDLDDINYRMRYTFSFRGTDINESPWSTDIYTSYRQNGGSNTEGSTDLSTALRVYSAAVGYKFNGTSHLTVGRRINRFISNVGAIDGVQYEQGLGDFQIGLIGGSRPSRVDYGLNTSFMEYGGYIAHQKEGSNGFSNSSLAFFEQLNHGKIDRRFAYFQHNSSPFRHFNLFMSFELDLFQKVNEEESFKPRLSSLYVSGRYRFSRAFSLFASYDNRQNIIYFESDKNRVDQLLDQASRQGLRMRANWRFWKYFNLGISGGYRFQDGNSNESRTVYAYLTHSRIPLLNTSMTLTYNYVSTAYLDGQIYGLRFNKDLVRGKLFWNGYARYVDYQFATYSTNQIIAGTSFNWRVLKNLSLSLSYEGTFEEINSYTRVHVNLVQRF